VRSAEAADYLLGVGAKVDVKDDESNSPLHGLEDIDVARRLLAAKASVQSRNEMGETPLHCALQEHRDEVAMLLIDAGVDVNKRSGNKETPLHLAVGEGRASIVAALLNAGAKTDARADEGQTPLHRARASSADPAVIRLLLVQAQM
jgi:ankyrin repeat protein